MCSDKEYPMAAKTPAVVMAGDFTVKAGWTLGPRHLNDYELVYFPIGSDTQYRLADGRSYKLDEPCFVLTCPGQEHTYIFDEKKPTRHLFIHFVMQGSVPETGGGPIRRSSFLFPLSACHVRPAASFADEAHSAPDRLQAGGMAAADKRPPELHPGGMGHAAAHFR
ncbi:AraC family ligand binding domain-containing protein [Paenibacillus sp. TAB 01]|uniref:AraC family ligand binding domain-containing protein n=1 Tax=Paenibacillus sp. TAB 01 TaxID=3368988 RepID=UPI0037516DA8